MRVQQTVAYDKFHDNSLPLLKMSFSSKLLWLLHLEILAYLVDISKPENYGMLMSNLMSFKTQNVKGKVEYILETFSTFQVDMQHMIFSGRMKLISNDSLTRSRFFWPRGGCFDIHSFAENFLHCSTDAFFHILMSQLSAQDLKFLIIWIHQNVHSTQSVLMWCKEFW